MKKVHLTYIALVLCSTLALAQHVPPTAENDYYATDWSTTLEVTAPGLMSNDSAPNSSNPFTFLAQGPNRGSVEVNNDGSFAYTPEHGYSGTASFTYKISDGHSHDSAEVVIYIHPGNKAPIALDDYYSIKAEDRLIIDAPGILTNDIDLEGDDLTTYICEQPANGQAGINADGSFWYFPNDGFSGVETIYYKVWDGQAKAEGAIHITVMSENAPVANLDHVNSSGQAVIIDVLANDTDPDGDMLSVVSHSGAAFGFGEVVLNEDHTITYIPDAGFQGLGSFTYVMTDGVHQSTTMVTIGVSLADQNQPPLANDDHFETDTDTPVVLSLFDNDIDPEGAALEITDLGQTIHGSLSLGGAPGRYIFTPNQGYQGSESFTYTISDGFLDATATVTIQINGLGNAPVAVDDHVETELDQIFSFQVSGNDTDPDGDSLRVVSHTRPTWGSVVLTTPEHNVFTYFPPRSWHGTTSFTYTISDGTHESTATVTVVVTPPGAPPIANDDVYTVYANSTVNFIDMLANDHDPDGDYIWAPSHVPPRHGRAPWSNGTFMYTPDPGFVGTDTLRYQVTDGVWYTDAQWATITIHVVPQP